MPKNVDIEIFQIAKTSVDDEQVRKWLRFLEAHEYADRYGDENPDTSDPALLVALAAKRCYKSFEPGLNPNVSKVRKDLVDYFDNILASGHGSVAEHGVYSFAIENVSRVFTGEMNRHRAGWAISEGSMRFIRFDKDIPFWMPESFVINLDDDDDLRERKVRAQQVMMAAFADCERHYSELLDIWDMKEGDHNFTYKKKVTSALRRIVPMGVATGGVWTGNARALRHVLTMRCSAAAEEEICHVFSRIAKMMRDQEPLLFGDFEKDENGYWRPKYVKV